MQPAGVDVWLADLDAGRSRLDILNARWALVPDEERIRAAGIGEQIRAQRWVSARIVLRLVLATHVGLGRARAPFAITPRGKPSLASPGPEFSLSHSGALLLFAVSSVGPLGVDIETRTTVDTDPRRRAAIERAAMALAPHAPLPTQNDARRFLQAWTRLEAVAKASGEGIGHVLTELGLQGPAAGLTDRHVPSAVTMLAAQGHSLSVEDLALDAEAVAAIALPRRAQVKLCTFPLSLSGIGELEALAQDRG